MKKYGLHRNNFNSILKTNYPFKFKYIAQHIQGWCGLKLKSQNVHELSDLVKIFYDTQIEITEGGHLCRRPVFQKFLSWYNDTYNANNIETIKNFTPRAWTKKLFREELKKYVKFKSDKWQNIKLI